MYVWDTRHGDPPVHILPGSGTLYQSQLGGLASLASAGNRTPVDCVGDDGKIPLHHPADENTSISKTNLDFSVECQLKVKSVISVSYQSPRDGYYDITVLLVQRFPLKSGNGSHLPGSTLIIGSNSRSGESFCTSLFRLALIILDYLKPLADLLLRPSERGPT